MKRESVEAGDYVSIHEENQRIASGVILEVFDIPNTFGRKMYIVSVGGKKETYDDGFYSLDILSKAK
jgi:hypothetical protein